MPTSTRPKLRWPWWRSSGGSFAEIERWHRSFFEALLLMIHLKGCDKTRVIMYENPVFYNYFKRLNRICKFHIMEKITHEQEEVKIFRLHVWCEYLTTSNNYLPSQHLQFYRIFFSSIERDVSYHIKKLNKKYFSLVEFWILQTLKKFITNFSYKFFQIL